MSWTGITPTPGAYAIERADGTCSGNGPLRPLTAVIGTASSLTDTSVQGGYTYSYRVRAAADAAGKCQAILASPCVNATATGNCTLKPTFQGGSGVTSRQTNNCGLTVSWAPATSNCPLTPSVRYNIYRGTVPDFVPAPANRIATCVAGSSYLDTDNLASVLPRLRGARKTRAAATAVRVVAGTRTRTAWRSREPPSRRNASESRYLADGGGDGIGSPAQCRRPAPKPAWRIVTTANDRNNHTPAGLMPTSAGPTANDAYVFDTCAEVQALA